MNRRLFRQIPALLPQPLFWFSAVWCLLLLVPFVPILAVQTFSLPCRVEFATAVVLGGTLIFVFLCNLKKSNAFLRLSKQEIAFIILPCSVFTVWSGLSAFWAGNQLAVWHHTFVWTGYLLFYFLVRAAVARKQFLRITFPILVAVVWIISLPGVIEYFTVFEPQAGTTLGFRFSRYGEAFNVLLPVFLAFALRTQDKTKFWVLSATVVIIWLLVVSSLSRSALYLTIFGTFLLGAWCFLFHRSRLARRRMIGFLLTLVAVVTLSQLLMFLKGATTTIERAASETSSESTSVRPLFAMIALEMFKNQPLAGVGADNFGYEFIRYRERYAVANPSDPNLAAVEEAIPERAHNEFLQILSELGLPGAAVFGWFLGGIAFLSWLACRRRQKISLVAIGSLVGILLFLISSLASSYSFRMMQNGLVFFFIVALAAKDLFSARKQENSKIVEFSPRFAFIFAAVGLIFCVLLGAQSYVRAKSQFYVEAARRQKTPEEAAPFYDRAINIDASNATADYGRGIQLIYSERTAEAIPYLRKAIDKGIAVTAAYSYLATAQFLTGDAFAAEATMAEAVRIYPRSTFVRMRYAVLLEKNGKQTEAENQKNLALQTNPKQARTWLLLITEGARAVSQKAFIDKNYAEPMDLRPANAFDAMIFERGVINPQEKVKIDLN